MKIDVVGGGPAGLYFALLTKRRRPNFEIDVFEQNPRDATYGFGIVLADRGLSRIQQADPASFAMMTAAMYVTRHQLIVHREQQIFVERIGFGGALPRLRLLNILRECCEAVGVRLHFGTRDDGGKMNADLIVGADGVNSVVRQGHEAAFGTSSFLLTNRLAWYGTKRHFAYPILVFRTTPVGDFVAAAYPYSDTLSTFVAECDANTWVRSGMNEMSDDERQHFVERIFAPELAAEPLLNNKSVWRQLPVVRNRNWFAGNRVLIGDALHSAHPTIGSGTRIAMEDAIALSDAMVMQEGNVEERLSSFQSARQPSKQKMLDATERSFTWYEHFPMKMATLAPVDFVFDFMTRTGRISDARLAEEFPEFVRRYAPMRSAPVPA